MRGFSTPRKGRKSGRGGGAFGISSSKKSTTIEGYLNKDDGLWYCDQHRIRAAIFTVSKETRNKGRKFWRCSKNPREACSFFLWDEDARDAEVEAQANDPYSAAPTSTQRRLHQTRIVLPAPETPTRRGGRQRIFTGDQEAAGKKDCLDSSDVKSKADDDEHYGDMSLTTDAAQVGRVAAIAPQNSTSKAIPASQASSYTVDPLTQSQPSLSLSSGRKRKHPDNEDFSDGFDNSDMERDLAELADNAGGVNFRRAQQQPVTPTKQRQQPTTGVTNGGLPTPVSRNTPLIAQGWQDRSRSKRVRLSTPSGISTPTSSPLSNTAPPVTTGAASSPFLTTVAAGQKIHQDSDSYNITCDILKLLDRHIRCHDGSSCPEATAPVAVDLATLRATIRDRLDIEALKTRGIKLGRDAARNGIALRDARISELQERVVALEDERTMFRRQVTEYKERLDRFKQLLAED